MLILSSPLSVATVNTTNKVQILKVNHA